MQFYGDVSGHFRGLVSGGSSVCVVGVVGGPSVDCQRCPKRAVRRVTNIPEAKWNELKEIEKRRFFECFDSNTPPLSFGFASFTLENLHSLKDYHHIYAGDCPVDWDVLLTSFAYTEILFKMTDDPHHVDFCADRMASETQCEQLVERIEANLDCVGASYASSRQQGGIQAADCLAGGVREQKEGGEPWLDYISPDSAISDCKPWALTQLEHVLTEI